MALAAYVKFDGIEGECSESDHSGWVQVTRWNHQAEQKASPTQIDAGGPAAAKTEHCAIQIEKRIDKASPLLWEKLSSGGIIKEVTFDMMRPAKDGTAPVKIWEVKLDTVLVSKIELSGDEKGEDVPSEKVDLKYGKISWTYQTQNRDGGTGPAVPAGWDLIKNVKWTGNG